MILIRAYKDYPEFKSATYLTSENFDTMGEVLKFMNKTFNSYPDNRLLFNVAFHVNPENRYIGLIQLSDIYLKFDEDVAFHVNNTDGWNNDKKRYYLHLTQKNEFSSFHTKLIERGKVVDLLRIV